MGYVTKQFSQRLKEIREASGLTQAQLASELNVSRGAISYYEKGERTPDIEFLHSLAMHFELPLDFVMGYTDNIKEENRDMYEFYGLTDTACDELSRHPKIGHLISAILGHEDYYALKSIYRGIIENHNSFDISQMGYAGFLISDSLNKIIFDAVSALWENQFTPEEKEALRIKNEINYNELENLLKQWNEKEKQLKELHDKWLKEEAEAAKVEYEENAIYYSALEKIHEKFHETIEKAESQRQYP